MADSLWKIIADNEDGSPITDLTALVVARVLSEHPAVAEQLLAPVIRAQIRLYRRHEVRERENEAFGTGSMRRSAQEAGTAVSPLEGIRAIVRDSFWCPLTNSRVKWGEATVEQHRSRAEYQRTQGLSLIEDASRHDFAVELITEAGVTCLDEALKAASTVG
jgi:hypothetical protein